ncbi:hypothetical protein HZY86_01570 [Aerococcaceae bacterium DSM 111020]|nr:hypothetical protein [Aerococcaceae bacterium DSM 111020]
MPTLENTKPYYSGVKNVRTIPAGVESNQEATVTASDRPMSKGQKRVLSIGMIVFVVLIFMNLFVQYKDAQIVQEITRYEQSVGELNSQAEGVRVEIYQQVNYGAVKEAAKQEQMTIEEERVRDIGNE